MFLRPSQPTQITGQSVTQVRESQAKTDRCSGSILPVLPWNSTLAGLAKATSTRVGNAKVKASSGKTSEEACRFAQVLGGLNTKEHWQSLL